MGIKIIVDSRGITLIGAGGSRLERLALVAEPGLQEAAEQLLMWGRSWRTPEQRSRDCRRLRSSC